MIRFIGGKPRAGKTKRAVVWIIEILRTTSLPIVTNIALELKPWVDGKGKPRRGLLRVLQDKYGSTFDAERRLFLLADQDVRRFYSIRPKVPKESWESVEVLRVPECEDGKWRFDGDKYSSCAYLIDEAHVYFPGAAVAGTKGMRLTPELLGYASQAGRCGDLVFFLSQVLMNVDKQLRGVAQECHWMTNHVHCQMGPFRQGDRISYRVYATTPPATGEVWLTKGSLRYERDDIDSSYNTAAGVGVTGNTAADIGRKAKGIPSYFIGLLILGLAMGAYLFFFGVKGAAQKYFAMNPAEKRAGQQTNAPAGDGFSQAQLAHLEKMLSAVKAERGAVVPLGVPASSPAGAAVATPKAEPPVVVSWCRSGNQVAAVFKDGSVLWGGALVVWGSTVVIDGVRYPFRPEIRKATEKPEVTSIARVRG